MIAVGVPMITLMSYFSASFEPAVEPIELVVAFFRLEQHPRKLRHANDVESRLLHHPQIGLPAFLRPMLRVIVDADVNAAVFGEQIFLGRRPLGVDCGRSRIECQRDKNRARFSWRNST